MALKSKSFKAESRINWTRTVDENISLPDADIQLGAILRIADATEMMAKNYTELQNDLKWYEERYAEHHKEINSLRKSNAALRGHITRFKTKQRAILHPITKYIPDVIQQ
jgi:hypothetical protein